MATEFRGVPATQQRTGPRAPTNRPITPTVIPADWTLKNQDETHYQYIDPSGQVHLVSKATGVEETPRGYRDKLGSKRATIGDIRGGIHDELGVGDGSDPIEGEKFQMIVDAANAFGDYYRQDRNALDDARRLDMDTIARLQAAADGKVPSAAEEMFRRSTDLNASRALGLASTLGGSNPGMSLRAGLQAQQTAGARSAAEMAALRAKEMEAARAMLADQTARGRQAEGAGSAATGNTFANIVGAPYGAQERRDAADQAWNAELLRAGGQLIGQSDIRLKENIRPNPGMADDFLSRLNPQSFEYKNPGPNRPDGQRLGVMAQDLPRNDTMTGPDGTKWISADVINDVLAGLGRVNQKVEEQRQGQPGSVAGGPREYAAAMDYMTAPRRDVSTAARAASGMPPSHRTQTDEELQIANQMIPASVVRDFLAGLGMVK